MRNGKKRARSEPGSTKQPRNKYSDNPPDFANLASLYPSFKPFVFFSGGRPRIDWTDYNATRELTRILLLHDHGVNWWIPDGQLCPTVPNRSNYIHWINDLLSSEIIQKSLGGDGSKVKGFDIGTGANCIYPLLGASLFGWSFVGSDYTVVALEWAEKNVKSNPHISDLIEIRDSKLLPQSSSDPEVVNREKEKSIPEEAETTATVQSDYPVDGSKSYIEPAVLLGVVKENETFDFCMSNPPFFETFEESGLNPKTACGGTPEEMVCDGGEQAFVSRIIEDSAVLRQRFRWYTSMLGKKATLKFLISKLWEVGVTVVKTTEFVQGQTSRWGLAWSFMPTARKIIATPVVKKTVHSFMLENIKRQYSAVDVLQSVEEFFKSCGASCKLNSSTFSVDIVASNDQCNTISKNVTTDVDSARSHRCEKQSLVGSSLQVPEDNLSFRILVFQQMPGTLLIKGSLQQKDIPLSGLFSVVFGSLEESLKSKFCR
ncbi:U6 small nuclear RNA (adenine-(43)-N(6))-methyltransferase [Capsella rubella]|nr:U6 small nuclear RNA (adenine-(43)-N(6))-methyltransferase [Capsella rubella]